MQISLLSPIVRLAPILCTTALLALATAPAGYAHHKPGHGGGGDDDDPTGPDRIAGCVSFAPGPVTDDGLGAYCDGDVTTDVYGSQDSMQIAMNCQFNHFNVYPGGGVDAGGRYLFVTIAPNSFLTGITSCPNRSSAVDVEFSDTDMAAAPCDLNFDQLLRSSPTAINVCDLTAGQDIDFDIRFQNNIRHQSNCRGGKKKCGNKLEAFEIFYGTDGVNCPQATITCDSDDGSGVRGSCTQYTIAAAGGGCVANGNETAEEFYSLPFTATFTPLP